MISSTDLLQQLEHGGSAIVLLTRANTRDRVLAEIARFGGTVLRTAVSVEADVLPLIEKEQSAADVTARIRSVSSGRNPSLASSSSSTWPSTVAHNRSARPMAFRILAGKRPARPPPVPRLHAVAK